MVEQQDQEERWINFVSHANTRDTTASPIPWSGSLQSELPRAVPDRLPDTSALPPRSPGTKSCARRPAPCCRRSRSSGNASRNRKDYHRGSTLCPLTSKQYAFRLTINIVRQRGRVDGLREGLKLYQYGVRILERNTPLFWSIMKYAARFSDRKKPSTPQICEYLDRELRRIGQLKTGGHNKPVKKSVIAPPESWGCDTWAEALEIKRNDVDVLFSAARAEAHSEQFATLMAWSLWGHPRTAKPKRKP